MNKQIYSLVAIYFYILLIATIQCFTNNENLNKYVRKNENVHDEYEINGLYINNNGKFRYRSLSEHSTEDKEETVTISDNKSSKTKGDMHHSSIYDMATDDDNKPQKSKKSKFSSMFKRDKKDKDSDKTQETLDDDKSQETLDDDKSQETLDDDKSQETLDDDNKSKKSKFSSMFKRDKTDKDSDKTQETLNVGKSQEALNADKSLETLNVDKSQEALNADKSLETLNVDKSLETLDDNNKSKKSKFSSMFKRDKTDKDSDKSLETLDDDKSQETLDDDNKSKKSKFSSMFKRDKTDEKPSYGKVTVSYPNDKMPEIFSNNKEKNPPIVVKLENVTIHVDQNNSEHLSFLSCLKKITEEQNSNGKASK